MANGRLEQIGLALQGFGAGVGGQLSQFQAGLAQRQQATTQAQQAQDKLIKQARASDIIQARGALQRGDIQGALDIFGSRIESGQSGGIDMSDSQGAFDAINDAASSPEIIPNIISEFDDDLINLVADETIDSSILSSLGIGGGGKRTAIQQNLIAAGLEPGTPDFQRELLASIRKPGTQITIGDKGISKEREELAKGRVSQLTRLREQRETAIDTNQSLDVLENIDVKTGALEPAKQGIASFGKAFGVDTSGLANVAAGEGFNAEAKRIVLAVKASQKGPQTDKDEQTIRETVANLGNTKEGNQFIIDSARALNLRRIGRADFFDEFLEQNETLKGANREWSKFKRDTPMVSPVMRTPQGLPVFFYQFDQAVRSANPDATRPEILEAWRKANKRGGK